MPNFFAFKKFNERLITDEERQSALFSPEKYNEDYGLFINKDQTIGFTFQCVPVAGSEPAAFQQLKAVLSESFPADTHIQFLLYRSPDINQQMYKLKQIRNGFRHHIYEQTIDERQKFYFRHVEDPVTIRHKGVHNMGTVYDLKLFVSLKLPIAAPQPTQQELEEGHNWQSKINTTLSSLHLDPKLLDAKGWLRVMSTFFNWGDKSSWRADNISYDPNVLLRNQVLDYDTDVELDSKSRAIRVGSKYVRCLSPKRKPQAMQFGEAQNFAGDLFGNFNGLKTNYAVCVNIYYPQHDTKQKEIGTRRQLVLNQSGGKFAKLAPVLAEKERDLTDTVMSMNQGYRPLQLAYHVLVFSNSIKSVNDALTAAKNHWRIHRFELMEDRYIELPVFINSLPLCSETAALKDVQRYKTMTAEQAAPLIPINGEWKGTFTPHMTLLTRNAQIMAVSLDDTDSNMNAVIAAKSGSGKSFFCNDLATAYLSQGSRVWIIDKGGSYKGICETYGGSYISFESSRKISINPFPTLISLDGTPETTAPQYRNRTDIEIEKQEDAILSILISMATHTQPLTDLQIAQLRRIIKQVWCRKFTDTTVDDIAKECLDDEDDRVKDIGTQLYPFTSEGNYGQYFIGENTIKFDNQFVVLELEHLSSQVHLQQVVLLQMMMQISNAVYLNKDRNRSLVIADEAWDLLSKPATAKFMEYAYRQFRKYGSSFVMITQSINDLYNSPVGVAIIENSAFKFLLAQEEETINSIQRSGRLQLSDYDWAMLRSVRTIKGVYSEVLILAPNGGRGVGRLILNPFTTLLYSTSHDDVTPIRRYREQGLSIVKAIEKVLLDRGIT